MTIRRALVAIGLASLVLGACTGGDEGAGSTPTPATSATATATTTAAVTPTSTLT
ncbi:MAG: hypothetical protein O2798_00005 [Chloroflexi bacterium]|nr:hypothetical protein [Chloroflexota bacterium]MDA1239205.1 hypothetical protein [Chloroflexota bacterium]